MISKQEAQKRGLNIIDSTKENNPLKSMLEQNFPDTLSEGQVSLKAIATLLGINPHSNTQGYELTFTGKGLANTLYTTPVEFELSEEVERSKERESTQNSIIIGDNLDVLKILKSAYYEKIKMIYIDPPYNTKSENFIYPDDFRKDYRKILREVGLLEIDEEGNEVESKTLQTFRNITGSRSHSGWLSFMLPRLKLARDLLKEDGVIFISIDDNEQAQLKILCDEIFGEENFVNCFIWRRKTGASDSKAISTITEYIFCYAKNIEFTSNVFNKNSMSYDEKRYRFSDEYEERRGKYYPDNLDRGGIRYSDSLNYPIECPDGTLTYPNGRREFFNDGWVWTWGKEKLEWGIKNGFIEFRKSKTKESGWAVCYKNYLKVDNKDNLIQRNAPHKNLILDVLNTHATLELNTLLGGKVFDTPKPVDLIKFIIKLIKMNNDIILDFFAGSGTTAQAVMELNAEDGGNRRFILVQLPEEIKEDKNKTAFDFVKNELGRSEPKISDITIERVRRAGDKLRNEKGATSNVDIGYRVYSLGEKAKLSDEGSIIPHSANITPADIARNLALFAGKPLHTPLEEIVADKLFSCEDILCVVGIDKEVEEKILEEKNKAIFIDGYGTYTLESFLNLNIPNDERVSVVY